jgi:hypothetical protein
VVTVDRGRLVDRAWHGALNALRSFASSNGASPVEATEPGTGEAGTR